MNKQMQSENAQNNEHTVYALKGFGGVIAYGQCPEAGSDMEQSVAKLMDAAKALDARVSSIQGDPTLSAAGKDLAIREIFVQKDSVLKALGTVRMNYVNGANALNAASRLLYGPEPLDKGDFVGAVRDEEVRDWYRGLSGQALGDFAKQASVGQHADVVQALARSPVPDQVRAQGERLLAATVELSAKKQVGELAARTAVLEWGRVAANAIVRPLQHVIQEPGKTLMPIEAVQAG